MRQRIVYFDMMRGLIVLLVVIYHACCWGYAAPDQSPAVYARVNTVLANIRMPLLMIISGYLIHGLSKKGRAQVSDRVMQLVWLYALWMPVNLVMHLACAGVGYGVGDALAKMPYEWVNPTTEMWFIWCLGVYTIAAYAIRAAPMVAIVALLMLANAATYQFGWFSDQIAGTLVPRMSLFFFGGVFFHRQIRDFVSAGFSVRVLLALIAATIGVHYAENVLHERHGVNMLQGMESVLVSALVMYACKLLTMTKGLAEGIGEIGQKTLPIYLAHVPLILAFRGLLDGWRGPTAYAVPFALVVMVIAGALLLQRIAEAAGVGWLYRRPAWFDARYVHRALVRLYGLLPDRGMLAGR